MSKCRGRSGRSGGSGRVRITVRVRVIHAGRVQHATSSKERANSGKSKALGNSMFTYGEKNSVDEMQRTWEKVVQHIEIAIGQDISMELQTRTLMVIPEPTHIQEILDRHMRRVQL